MKFLSTLKQAYIPYLKFRFAGLFVLVVISAFVESSQTAVDNNSELGLSEWRTFNIYTVNNYIIPAYERLEKSSQGLDEAINNFCLNPQDSNETLNLARTMFNQTMDAWQYIQNVQFGPIQILMRNYSMQFWPDKKNHVSKHLTSLLETNDPNSLSDTEFHKASVSIKGLPAIERFLFEEDEIKALATKPFNCQVLLRISKYTANTSKSLVEEWRKMKKHFYNTAQSDAYFEDDLDASTTLLKALIEPIEVIRDLKLRRPLGSEFGQQKEKRLESWRSQRSLRNIQINLKSLEDLYISLNTHINTDNRTLVTQLFGQIQEHLKQIKSPLETSINTESGYKDIITLSELLKSLHSELEKLVTEKGIHLGFNSRDGD